MTNSFVQGIAKGDRRVQIAMLIMLLFVFLAATADVFFPVGKLDVNVKRALQPPSAENPLGTDYVGRDVLAMLAHGTRSALLIILATQVCAFALGVSLGMISGYVGGKTDLVAMRAVDAILAFPTVVFALVLAAALGTGLLIAILAVVIYQIAPYARLSRVLTLGVKSMSFFDGAQVIGAGARRILLLHVFPNIRSPLIVQSAFGAANAMLTVASLSFLGVGVQPPAVDWGLMMYESRSYLTTLPQLELLPGLMIAILILCLNTIAEALRDSLDPHMRLQIT
jgi:ABC-type dipeptide/oligopeptide/nickel transport system permease subunit